MSSSSKPILTVLGATGTQGSSVISNTYLSTHYHIRAITRNPASTAAQKIASSHPDIEIVRADLSDRASLIKAFEGSTVVFSVTDFWTVMWSPSTAEQAKREGKTMARVAYEVELQQGKNVIDAVAATKSVERLVFSSLADVTEQSGGKFTHVYHFDAKGHAEKYAKEHVPAVYEKMSSVHLGMYVNNWLNMAIFMPRKDENGVYVFTASIPADQKLPMVAAEKDTGPFVESLIQAPLPVGKAVLAYREWMSMAEFAPLWGKVLGVETRYQTKPVSQLRAEMAAGMPGTGMDQDMGDSMESFSEMGYSCVEVDNDLLHPSEMKQPPKLGTVEEWIKAQDWTKVLDGSLGKGQGASGW